MNYFHKKIYYLCLICALFCFNALYSKGQVVINELYYNPPGSDDSIEFIELWNPGNENINVSGWFFSNGVDFVFDENSIISAGNFAVIARYIGAFSNAYPHVNDVYGPFENNTKLSNSGELITLCDSNNNFICSFTYDDKLPWPEKADGEGPTLELKQPLLPVIDSASWAASLNVGGTHGKTNSTYIGVSVVVPRGTVPLNPVNGQTVSVTAEVFAPASVTSLTLHYSTNRENETVVNMYDDGSHGDLSSDDLIYGGSVPSMPNATYVWYYFKLILDDGSIAEFPPKKEIENIAPPMTVRLSQGGLLTNVFPKNEWQTAAISGKATSSRLYFYLNDEGEVLVDDVSITYNNTEYIQNGTFTDNDSGWSKTGNHSGSLYKSTLGYSSPGCENIIAIEAGGSSDNSFNCYTSPDLQLNSTIYTLSFAYRAAPKIERDWYSYYVGFQNWNDLRINEFMSWNDNFLKDENGDYSDWIEIYNRGNEPLNLYGCGLSDELSYLNKWVFPPYILKTNSYLLIFASGKNRYGSELHTNFKIKSEGEPLILSSHNGSVIDQLSPVFVPQNKSYGRLPNGVTNLVFFDSPTPNCSNGGDFYSSVAESPQFSRCGGFFTGNLSLTLSVASTTAEIRYTLDNTTPTNNSPVYSSPLTLNSTIIVKARVFDTDALPGRVVSHKYYSGLPAGVLSSSRLPIIVLDSLGESIPDEPKITARMGIIWNQNGETNFVTDPFNDYDGKIGIEIRGQTSAGWPKKQYGIETRNNSGDQIDSSLLGLPEESDWVLNGPYSDKSLMRNALAYYTQRQMAAYAPRIKFCEVILNGSYNGVYLLIEKICRSKNRIDISKLEPYENTEPDISGGYILKIDKTDSGDVISYTDGGVQIIHVYPKAPNLTETQKNWIINYLNEFEHAITTAGKNEVLTAAEKYIDVNSFVDNYLHVEFTRNVDGLRLSAYMYKDKNEKLVMGPQWDYNLALGNANYFDGWKTNGWVQRAPDAHSAPFWWDELLSDTNFVNLCSSRWKELRQNVLATSNLLAQIDVNVQLLGDAVDRNFTKWPVLGKYVWPNYYVADTYEDEISWIKQWIENRASWMDTAWYASTNFPDWGDVTKPGDPITPTSDNSPSAESVSNVIDNNIETKYLNFDKENSGFTVTPSIGATIVTGIVLVTANDKPERDPASVTIRGSIDGTNFFDIVTNMPTALPDERFSVATLWFNENVSFYRYYEIIFPTIKNTTTANSMQIAEVSLVGEPIPEPAVMFLLIAVNITALILRRNWG